LKQCFKPELITFIEFSERHKKQGNILFYFVLSFFLLISASGFFIPAFAQNIPLQQTLTVMEAQDYAFAFGLYCDGLFQLACRRFQTFVSLSPDNIKRRDDSFRNAECFFQSVLLSIPYTEVSNSGEFGIKSDWHGSPGRRIYLGI